MAGSLLCAGVVWVSRAVFLVLATLPGVITALVVLARDRGWRWLFAIRLRRSWLIWFAAGVQVLHRIAPSWTGARTVGGDVALALVIWLAATAFCLANMRTVGSSARPGLAIFATGLTLNTLATVANGGMPYSPDAARIAGLGVDMPQLPGHLALTPHSHLTVLADILPIPRCGQVISIGDILLIVGLTGLLIAIARHPGTAAVPVRDRKEVLGTCHVGAPRSSRR